MTWHVTGLHHVAIAAGEDRTGEALFAALLGSPVHTEEGDGFTERMYAAGGPFLQTLQAGDEGVVRRFVDKRGPGLHHIAFVVDRLDDALADLDGRGVALIDHAPRPGGMGTRVAFLHPSAAGGVLIELVEDPDGGADG
jgi:methylmalonyl-CoA/ethylmalonyl-CoA epimerase